MYKIYKKNNYLIIDDSVTTHEEYLTKDILIKELETVKSLYTQKKII